MAVKISVRELSVAFGTRKILDRISFDLLQGESLSIIGKSGEGKSVLLKSIIGLIPRQKGQVFVDEAEIKEDVERNVEKHDISISFQNDCLFDSMTILENLCFPIIKKNATNKKEASQLAREVVSEVGLSENILSLYPSTLSGGMKKRVAIARTIITRSKIVLFDEPTTGLDPVTSGKITEIIKRYTSQKRVSSIIVTHSLKCARMVSDKIAMLRLGKIIWYGDTESLEKSDDPHVKDFLLYA